MILSRSEAPIKPRRHYLPLSLSFDDVHTRRRRIEKRLAREQGNEPPFGFSRGCPRRASVRSEDTHLDIPYIDADPFSAPLSSWNRRERSAARTLLKSSNCEARPKSVLITNSEIFNQQTAPVAVITSPPLSPITKTRETSPVAGSPAILTYSEWKKIFDQKDKKIPSSTPFAEKVDGETKDSKEEGESSHARKMNSKARRLLRGKRSCELWPPLPFDDHFGGSTHSVRDVDNNDALPPCTIYRCNSDSAQSPAANEESFAETKESALKRQRAPRGSTHSSKSVEWSLKRVRGAFWFPSAGTLKNALWRTRKHRSQNSERTAESQRGEEVKENGNKEKKGKSNSMSQTEHCEQHGLRVTVADELVEGGSPANDAQLTQLNDRRSGLKEENLSLSVIDPSLTQLRTQERQDDRESSAATTKDRGSSASEKFETCTFTAFDGDRELVAVGMGPRSMSTLSQLHLKAPNRLDSGLLGFFEEGANSAPASTSGSAALVASLKKAKGGGRSCSPYRKVNTSRLGYSAERLGVAELAKMFSQRDQ